MADMRTIVHEITVIIPQGTTIERFMRAMEEFSGLRWKAMLNPMTTEAAEQAMLMEELSAQRGMLIASYDNPGSLMRQVEVREVT